jgi:hypothetical protein
VLPCPARRAGGCARTGPLAALAIAARGPSTGGASVLALSARPCSRGRRPFLVPGLAVRAGPDSAGCALPARTLPFAHLPAAPFTLPCCCRVVPARWLCTRSSREIAVSCTRGPGLAARPRSGYPEGGTLMSPAVLITPGPRQMAAAGELPGHSDQALNGGCREHPGAQVSVHPDRGPHKHDIRRDQRARCRRRDSGWRRRLTVLCPALRMPGCGAAYALSVPRGIAGY